MSGSSPLTAEQQEWYEQRFGVRYIRVQTQPFQPPRRVRRKWADSPERPAWESLIAEATRRLQSAAMRPA